MRLVRQGHHFLIATLFISLISCSRNSNHQQVQGYVEGRYTYIATSVSGVVKQLLVQRGAWVKQGDILFALEQQPESDVYNAAVENLKEAVAARDAIAANVAFSKLTFERYKILVPQRAIQQSQLDNARSAYEAGVAQLAQANAHISSTNAVLEQSKWSTSQKTQAAPVDALVFDTYYRLGEYAEANKPILALLAPADIKVIFYVIEPDLKLIKLQQAVSVKCDSCEHAVDGKISYISSVAEYTPPVIFSNETNSKLIYRIEAEFKPSDARTLHAGQPVTVAY